MSDTLTGNQHSSVHTSEAGIALDDSSWEQRPIASILAAAWLFLLQLSHVFLFSDQTTQHPRRSVWLGFVTKSVSFIETSVRESFGECWRNGIWALLSSYFTFIASALITWCIL